MANIIAYDLGTGGTKASLFNEKGESLAESFTRYETYYPRSQWIEQRPMDWWEGVCQATQALLRQSGLDAKQIDGVAVAGHSIVTVPVDKQGQLLQDQVPIWCDMRATDVLDDFFDKVPYTEWYNTTGAGDPPEGYSIFKLMWLKKHRPEIYKQTAKVMGSKDFINYQLTDVICTDPSYATSFAVFNLKKWMYEDHFIQAAEIDRSIFPEIKPSDSLIGHVTAEAAGQTGLAEGTPVVCGGVDNMCMALGARGIGEGNVYTSLGSSSWIAVTSKQPVLDDKTLPFVYAHAVKGYYTSAVSIFSAGNSFRWVHDELCKDVPLEDRFDRMNEMAAKVPVGSNGILFNPTLAGGSSQEKSLHTKGSFSGITLGSKREDLVRASMEGIAFALRSVLDILKQNVSLEGQRMLMCGGGSKSPLWMQMFADIYSMDVIKTNVDQDAASLGAAALAANALGVWDGYDQIEAIHQIETVYRPNKEAQQAYKQLLTVYKNWSEDLADVGDNMQNLHTQGVW